jgi:hypothetical protein
VASPSVTYTFSNSTTADATQVNQNFTDIINGLTDGTKDLSISALTVAGNFTFTGTTFSIGNASSDTLSITASLASSIAVSATYSWDIGGSTAGIKKLYLGSSDSAARTAAIAAGAVTSSYTLTLPTAVPAVANCVLEADTSANLSFTPRSNRATVAKTANYTATLADEVILCDASGGSFTITLPAAASSNKKTLLIKRTDQTLANAVTIDGNASETIDGATTRALATKYESLVIVCDGSNWHVLHHHIDENWNSFTPTGSWSANTTYTGFWRRDGDSIYLQYHLALSGAPTSASLTLNLPSGLTIDTNKLTSVATNQALPGNGNAQDEGVAQFPIYPHYSSTTAISVTCYNHAGTTYTVGNSVTQAVPVTFGNTDTVKLKVGPLPITGWDG